MKIKIISFIIVLLAFIGCKGTQNNSNDERTLESEEYAVLKLKEDSVQEFNLTLNFNLKENRISGFAGCNNYSGNIKVETNKLTVNSVVSTKKFCQEASERESKFLKSLNEVQVYSFEGETLQLKSNEGTVLIEAKKAN
jgi:heat shock protein HslJ